MATAMLLRARKDQGRALRAKRQISFDGSEKPPPRSRDAVTSPLTAVSEDPPAPLVTPPATDNGAIRRTSTPNDSGLESEEDRLPSYEVMLAEQFSPISSPPLVPSILSSIDEDPIMAARQDDRTSKRHHLRKPRLPLVSARRDQRESTSRRFIKSRRRTSTST